jgi:hypothetical protein
MVISDTAVGIGKVPEAQLDVRGNLAVRGVIQSECPAFSACRDDGDVLVSNYIVFNLVNSNRGNCYDSSTGKFTAPITGLYFFGYFAATAGSTGFSGRLHINGTFTMAGMNPWASVGSSSWQNIAMTGIVPLNAGDYVQMYQYEGRLHATGATNNQFCGYFIG